MLSGLCLPATLIPGCFSFSGYIRAEKRLSSCRSTHHNRLLCNAQSSVCVSNLHSTHQDPWAACPAVLHWPWLTELNPPPEAIVHTYLSQYVTQVLWLISACVSLHDHYHHSASLLKASFGAKLGEGKNPGAEMTILWSSVCWVRAYLGSTWAPLLCSCHGEKHRVLCNKIIQEKTFPRIFQSPETDGKLQNSWSAASPPAPLWPPFWSTGIRFIEAVRLEPSHLITSVSRYVFLWTEEGNKTSV